MYIITLMNNKGQTFEKKFYSGFYFDRFLNKVKYSKRLKILSYERTNEDE